MMICFRALKIHAARGTFQLPCPEFTIWILTAIGTNRPITVGSGRRAASQSVGRRIVQVTGDIIPAGDGLGFLTNRGDGFRIITVAGRGIAAVGVGFPRFQSAGDGRRIKSPFSAGDADTIADTVTDITMG